MAYVAEFTSDIRHVAGIENVVADTLSRPPAEAVQPPAVGAVVPPASTGPLNWTEIASGQSTCSQMSQLLTSSSLQLKQVEVEGVVVWCDVATGVLRPVIPQTHRRHVFLHVHGLAHAGTRATTRMLSSRFVWPKMAVDVKEWCKECVSCQKAKVTVQEKTTVEKIRIPQQRFSHVHVDIVGPWATARTGERYLLTVIDRSTRWFEAAAMKNITAEGVLDCFVATWVSRFGIPATLTTDRGTQFTSGVWGKWCADQKVNHITTTAFHPQANGMVERLHRQLKEALRARGAAENWLDHLPWVLLGVRTAPKDESGISAAEATLGQQLVVPGQLQDTRSAGAARATCTAGGDTSYETHVCRGGFVLFRSGSCEDGLHQKRRQQNTSCYKL
jgi:transposase InsO family protein